MHVANTNLIAAEKTRKPNRGFASRFVIEIDDNSPRKWKLTEKLAYQVSPNHIITVHAGFHSDLASVPRLLRGLALADIKTCRAAVIHDYLYATRPIHRALADEIFRCALLDTGVHPAWALIYYKAVRWFGWLFWPDGEPT